MKCPHCRQEYEPHERSKDLIAHIRHLLSGAMFPPKAYTDRNGLEKVWDDREFLESMLKHNGEWSPAQEALLRKTFNFYEENGHKLQGVEKASKPTKLDIPERMGSESLDLENIPF